MIPQKKFSLIDRVMNPVEKWTSSDHNFIKRVLGTRAICLLGGVPTMIASTIFHAASLAFCTAPLVLIKKTFSIQSSKFTENDLKEEAKKTAYFALSIFMTLGLSLISPDRLICWYIDKGLLTRLSKADLLKKIYSDLL